MTAAQQARDHLVKAQEFLAVADECRHLGRSSSAVSNAVIAGINAKDAICLTLTGRTEKSDNHHKAVAELKAAGGPGPDLAAAFGRLLRLKTSAQYQSGPASAADAAKAVEWAGRLCASATKIARP